MALAAGAAGVSLAMRAREGLPGIDEGYLWYGTLRLLAGDAPLRDFRSYEPGRYYWCALASRCVGRGIVGLRVAVHAFFALGVLCGLLALRLGGVGWPAVGGAALLLAIWAHPGHKLFEPAVLMVAILAGTQLVAAPDLASELTLGFVVGLSGFFGINLALYTGTAGLALTLLVSAKASGLAPVAGLSGLAAGCVAGCLPLLIWFRRVPGSMGTFWDRRVRTVMRRGATNLPLRVPWPWRFLSLPDPLLSPPGNLALGLLFALLPLVGAGIWLWALLATWSELHGHPALVAGGAIGLVALHHAYSRADLNHLASVVAPFIIVSAALLPHGPLALLPLIGLGSAGLVTAISAHPRRRRRQAPNEFRRAHIGSSRIWANSRQSDQLGLLSALVDERLQEGEPVVLVPTLASLLPMLGRRSAVYDTFCVYPASNGEQERMLGSIEEESVRLVVVHDFALDRRDDLRFARTHPMVWEALETEFERLAIPGLAVDHHVFWRDLGAKPRPRGNRLTRAGEAGLTG